LKRWRRAWKIALIEKTNPEWRDLFGESQSLFPDAPRSLFFPDAAQRETKRNGAPLIRQK
jgi:hypothetical protein